MRFKDQLAFVLQHMKKNKLRVTMTVLAAMIGCAFLIVLASIGFGIQETLRNEILNNENVTEIQLWESAKLDEKDRTWIESREHVNSVLDTFEVEGGAEVSFEDREAYSQIKLYDMTALVKLPSTLSEGRLPEGPNEVVIGYHFAQSLLNEVDQQEIERKSKEAEQNGTWYDGSEEGYKESLMGKEVLLQFTTDIAEGTQSAPEPFTVVGISKAPSYEWAIDNSVTLSKDLMSVYPTLTTHQETTIYVDSMEYVMPILDELKEQGYQVYSVLEQMKEVDLFFLVLKIGLIFIGTIAVLIASIGIFNTMTMAVTERTREIGVLKAIGASPALVQRLFLMESTFIGVLGTALAIAVSYTISFLSNLILPHVVSFALSDADLSDMDITFSLIPLNLVVVAGAISLIVAILSGWRPARKATKIEVIQALRQEL